MEEYQTIKKEFEQSKEALDDTEASLRNLEDYLLFLKSVNNSIDTSLV